MNFFILLEYPSLQSARLSIYLLKRFIWNTLSVHKSLNSLKIYQSHWFRNHSERSTNAVTKLGILSDVFTSPFKTILVSSAAEKENIFLGEYTSSTPSSPCSWPLCFLLIFSNGSLFVTAQRVLLCRHSNSWRLRLKYDCVVNAHDEHVR